MPRTCDVDFATGVEKWVHSTTTLDPTNATYVNKGNALKELKVKRVLSKEDNTRDVTDNLHLSKHYRLPSVFVQSGTPEITFVARQDFQLLMLSLEQSGRGVVIEGPSGVGKTTSVEKAIEDLKKIRLHIPIQQTLSARNPEHRTAIQTLRKWHDGIVIIDDFHRLEQALATRDVRPGLIHHSDRGV